MMERRDYSRVKTREQEIPDNEASTATDEPYHYPTRPFIPVWTSTSVLTCFIILFGAIFIVLELLDLLSSRDQGLCRAVTNQHYFWVYGPTAGKPLL